jgi:hypothetical protein
MKSGTQLLIVRSSGAKLKIAISRYKRRRFFTTIHHLRHLVSIPEADSTGNEPKHVSCPLSPCCYFRGHEVDYKTDAPLFLLRKTEMNVPHDREARMHEQKPFYGFIKEREGHEKGGGKTKRKKIQREPNLHITIGFIFLQYQPPETKATEQGKHKNKRGEKAEKNRGRTGEANETETERSIGQPTHEHQPCLGLHRPLNRRTTSGEDDEQGNEQKT